MNAQLVGHHVAAELCPILALVALAQLSMLKIVVGEHPPVTYYANLLLHTYVISNNVAKAF